MHFGMHFGMTHLGHAALAFGNLSVARLRPRRESAFPKKKKSMPIKMPNAQREIEREIGCAMSTNPATNVGRTTKPGLYADRLRAQREQREDAEDAGQAT